MVSLCQAAHRKKIFGLADANPPLGTVLQHIEQCCSQRFQREVAPVFGAREISRCADKWARDHAPHCMLPGQHSTSNTAPLVQLRERYHLLVRSELENALRRSVQDRTAGAQVLLAEFLDDFSA